MFSWKACIKAESKARFESYLACEQKPFLWGVALHNKQGLTLIVNDNVSRGSKHALNLASQFAFIPGTELYT